MSKKKPAPASAPKPAKVTDSAELANALLANGPTQREGVAMAERLEKAAK